MPVHPNNKSTEKGRYGNVRRFSLSIYYLYEQYAAIVCAHDIHFPENYANVSKYLFMGQELHVQKQPLRHLSTLEPFGFLDNSQTHYKCKKKIVQGVNKKICQMSITCNRVS
jgi:hypothetical protein